MSANEELIAAAKSAAGDEAAMDAADLAIEAALKSGWDVALVSQLINDYTTRFRRRSRADRIRRHRALATAVGYLRGMSPHSRAFYAEAAMWPDPDDPRPPAEFLSVGFALRVDEDRSGSSPDLGGGIRRRTALLDDEGLVDARAMLDAADRLLEAVRPDSPEQFRLLLDRAHALLMLSDDGRRAGPLGAARRTLARAERIHEARDPRLRSGYPRLELMLVQSHASLGDDALSPQRTATALREALDDAIAAGDDTQPVVLHAYRHLTGADRMATATREHASVLRRLLGLELAPPLRTHFLMRLTANLWTRADAEKSPRDAEEALAIGRLLHAEGTIDDEALAATLLRAVTHVFDHELGLPLLLEARALRRDLPTTHEVLLCHALIHLSETGGGAGPAYEAIEITVARADARPEIRRHALAIRGLAVRALIRLGAPAAFAELASLLSDADDENVIDTSIVVAYEVEIDLAQGRVELADAAAHLYSRGVAHDLETAMVPIVELLDTPAGAVFPRLRAAMADRPAFAAAFLDALPIAPWSAPMAGIAAQLAENSEYADRTERRAIELLEAVVAAGDDAPDAKPATELLAVRLLTRSDRARARVDGTGDVLAASRDLDRAIELLIPDDAQRSALNPGLRRRLLRSIERAQPLDSRLDRLLRMLLQDAVYDESDTLTHRLGAASAYQHLFAHLFWGVVWGPFGPLTDALERELDRARPEVLEVAQGLASRAAYAAAASGRVVLAVEIAERGQGLLAARALQRLGRATSGLHVEHGRIHGAWRDASLRLRRAVESSLPTLNDLNATAPSRPPTRKLERTEALAELARISPDLSELIAEEARTRSDLEAAAGFVVPDPDITTIVSHLHRRGAQLSYLVATTWGGTAVTVRRDGSIAVTDLPELTERACIRWQGILADSRPVGPLREAVVRGVETQPDLADAEAVLAELAEALRPLAEELSLSAGAVELVPTGRTAVLPVTAALQTTRGDAEWFEISTAASARLHIVAESRAELLRDASAVTAITDPVVVADEGCELPPLAYATREGDGLAERYGARHHTGADATGALARLALREPHRVLHFAVHGESDADDPSASRVYLAGGVEGRADALTAGEMSREVIASRLVYLGACWTGRPGVRLPQEAIGFPTLLLQSGAGGVVAPLWPVEDGASFTFASTFYRSWIERGNSTAKALADAMRTTKQRHPSTPTWAAFSLYGA